MAICAPLLVPKEKPERKVYHSKSYGATNKEMVAKQLWFIKYIIYSIVPLEKQP